MSSTYEITEVDSDPRTWIAKKGPAAGQEFLSYEVRAKGPDGEEHTYEISTKPTSPPPALGPGEFEVKPSSGDFPDKLKRVYQGSANGSQGRSGGGSKDAYWENKEQRDIESQARMGRAHAQEMALRWLALPVDERPHLPRHGEVPALPKVIDWFHADVQRFPLDAGGSGGSQPEESGQARAGAGETPVSAPVNPAAASANGDTGFVSTKQKMFFERLLRDAGVENQQLAGIVRYVEEALPTDRLHKAIDILKEGDKDAAVSGLLVESDKWARQQTDLPWVDDGGLPPA